MCRLGFFSPPLAQILAYPAYGKRLVKALPVSSFYTQMSKKDYMKLPQDEIYLKDKRTVVALLIVFLLTSTFAALVIVYLVNTFLAGL